MPLLLLLLLLLKTFNTYCQTASKETGLVSIPTKCPMPHPTIVLQSQLPSPCREAPSSVSASVLLSPPVGVFSATPVPFSSSSGLPAAFLWLPDPSFLLPLSRPWIWRFPSNIPSPCAGPVQSSPQSQPPLGGLQTGSDSQRARSRLEEGSMAGGRLYPSFAA